MGMGARLRQSGVSARSRKSCARPTALTRDPRSLIPAFARRLLCRARRRLPLGGGPRFGGSPARGAARLRGGGLFAAPRASRLHQADGLFEGDRFRGEVGGQRGVDPVVTDIGPVTPVL